MARRALASAAQLRELDGAWEKVATELSAAVTFALSQRAKDPLAAIVEHLIRHLPAGSMAALRAENAGLHAQVQELTLENEQLKRESSVRDVPGEEAAASAALQALRGQVQAVLAELEAAKPATAAAGTTASLPDGLKDFTPLAKEPEIKAIAERLHELDLAVARSHTSEAALAALRAKAKKLALATRAKITTRTATDKSEELISECAAAILAGNRDFQRIYHAVYDVIRSGEADGMEAAQAAIAALGQAVRGDPKRLQQRDEAAEPATLLADAAGARPAFAEVVRCLSEATGARRGSK